MAEMRAGFEPDRKVNDTSGILANSAIGTEIGTTTAGSSRHCQSCRCTDALSEDFKEVIDAWPELSGELRSAVIAITRSRGAASE